jgi:ketosteroid isomerase-like protein
MMRNVLSIAAVSVLVAAGGLARAANDDTETHIIALERGALDRWGKGDPQGFFDIMSNDETYFDPETAKRIDGKEALRGYVAPFTGKISIDRFELIDPKVQRHGEVAILTFNLVSYGARMAGGPKSTVRWNSTEIYQRRNGQWKIVHSHWSYTKPEPRATARD